MSFIEIHSLYEHLLGVGALVLLVNGLDDLVPSLICCWPRLRKPNKQVEREESDSGERRVAIFVACWRESAVIEEMVRHNMAAIRYENFDLFLGTYPNDEETARAVEKLVRIFPNVHGAACPHPGPTSKADCLNWIYQRMLLFEEDNGLLFDTIVVHDAEDIIHPDALRLMNEKRRVFDMVQIPVLPIATSPGEFTHGVYCDDFAEYQTIDMPARQISGAFLPSNGVGTAYSRAVLVRMAEENHNLAFEPSSLTEDYDGGIRIHAMGFTQCFCRLQCASEVPTATREYFPRTFRGAVRQRTRWVMGIALQGWERNGWKRSMLTNYWFWRDRKGLLANPLGVVANAAFLAGAFTWIWSRASEQPWALEVNSVWVEWVCAATLLLQCAHLAIRMECVRRLFGPWMAVTVPLRVFHENVMNSLATVQAVFRYSMARWQGRPLAWLKTDHSYPDRAQLRDSRRGLEEILVSMGKIAADALAEAKSQLQAGEALESYLLKNGFLDDRDLARAISLLEGVEIVSVAVETVNPRVARAIPARLGEELTVIPYRVSAGCMMIAGPKVPQPNWRERLSRITRLHLEFHLVTWGNFEELKTLIA